MLPAVLPAGVDMLPAVLPYVGGGATVDVWRCFNERVAVCSSPE
jgi:hypothetical protein